MIDYESSYRDTLLAVAARAKALRVSRELKQEELARRAGIGVATVIRFERTGHASFENVLRIATALNAEGGFERLFELPPFSSLDEALMTSAPKKRRRVRAS